ncbi:hypothetical protein I4U23_024344 [Adineta vaga]|nr:hypothetical protein I4U23_024344 [Adineta vaga]
MGSGCSDNKRKDPTKQHSQQREQQQQQPLPIENRTNSIRSTVSMADASRQSPDADDDRQNRRLTQTLQQRSPSEQIITSSVNQNQGTLSPTDRSRRGRKNSKISIAPSSQANDGIHSNKDLEMKSKTRSNTGGSTSNKSSIHDSTSNKSSRHDSTLAKNHVQKFSSSSEDEQTPRKLPEIVGRCSFCPHCQSSTQVLLPKNQNEQRYQPPWVIQKAPSNKHLQINMDKYDQDAVREQLISDYGHFPGSYDYRPHLAIDDRTTPVQLSNMYCTLPTILKHKRAISPIHTPFPDYNTLQRRDQRLNKPYTTQLFED